MKSRALLLIVVLSQVTCHQVIFHAPPGSTVECFANPTTIAAFNGVSVISCILQEEIGTPVADGTVVQFFTNLGRIPEQGKTNDGVVRVNFQADGRSGEATVRVISGGGSIPSPTTAPTTTLPGGTTLIPVRGSGEVSASSGASSLAVMADTEVTVTVGNLAAEDILVTASPTRIVESRSSQITASVFDGNGNPVAGVPVIFTLESAQVIGPAPTPTGTPTPGPTATPTGPVGNEPTFEHMDSQGSPIFTDSNGRATDVLRTRYPRDAAQRAVVVTATVPGRQLTGTTRVIIN